MKTIEDKQIILKTPIELRHEKRVNDPMQKAFSKDKKQLLIEEYFRHCYEKAGDTEYQYPHTYKYYREELQGAAEMFSLQITEGNLEEEVLQEKDIDVHFHHQPAFFPPVWHTNSFFSVQIMLDGEFTGYIADQKIRMRRGNICIVAPEARHALSCFSDGNLLCILIRRSTFEKAFLGVLRDKESILADFFSRILYGLNPHPFLFFPCAWDPALMEILKNAYLESLRNDEFRNRMVNSLVDQFFIMLLRNHGSDVVFGNNSVRKSENLLSILKYIQDHYTTVTLKELADLFNYSERQVQRILKTYMGLSFTEIIQNAKMKEAARLLRGTNYPISKITDILGYNNQGNFRDIFRKTYEQSPTEYRNSQRKDQQGTNPDDKDEK